MGLREKSSAMFRGSGYEPFSVGFLQDDGGALSVAAALRGEAEALVVAGEGVGEAGDETMACAARCLSEGEGAAVGVGAFA